MLLVALLFKKKIKLVASRRACRRGVPRGGRGRPRAQTPARRDTKYKFQEINVFCFCALLLLYRSRSVIKKRALPLMSRPPRPLSATSHPVLLVCFSLFLSPSLSGLFLLFLSWLSCLMSLLSLSCFSIKFLLLPLSLIAFHPFSRSLSFRPCVQRRIHLGCALGKLFQP